jgi:hypothetical protein
MKSPYAGGVDESLLPARNAKLLKKRAAGLRNFMVH